jgi:hypothetical protein
MHLFAVSILVLLGSTLAGAQASFLSSTSVPRPTPGGAAAIGEPTAMSTMGAGSPGVIQHPQPIILHVGGEGVAINNRACADAIGLALEKHASVATSDPECATEMTRVLEIQRTKPEPTGWATP